MKIPGHISYSGFKLFEKDPEAYYRMYLAEAKGIREPQNHFMAVGSAFDAFVKVHLHNRFVGTYDGQFTLPALFQEQVEEHNRDRAWDDGWDVWTQYVQCGAFDDLCREMEGCTSPRFEATITGTVCASGFDGGVLILGKPDVQYFNRQALRVIHDFKVNGYYSKSPPSPREGYLKLFQHTNGIRHVAVERHKKAAELDYKGHKINGAGYFSSNCEDWAEQLSMYAWVMGEEVGSDYVLSVDQMCCNSVKKVVRVAKHAGLCSEKWQRALYARLHRAWHAIHSGHIFLHLGYDANLALCKTIELEMKADMPEEFVKQTSSAKRVF